MIPACSRLRKDLTDIRHQMFGKTPDPDFTEASLLEQYQAQIGSALTPAFAADSSAELASEAINVSATFIATGIVTNVERMGRILKLLVLGLENFSSECAHQAFASVFANETKIIWIRPKSAN